MLVDIVRKYAQTLLPSFLINQKVIVSDQNKDDSVEMKDNYSEANGERAHDSWSETTALRAPELSVRETLYT